jgi:hypothetical protein
MKTFKLEIEKYRKVFNKKAEGYDWQVKRGIEGRTRWNCDGIGWEEQNKVYFRAEIGWTWVKELFLIKRASDSENKVVQALLHKKEALNQNF